MGRTKLRGIEIAGLKLGIEVPPSFDWAWPSGLSDRACLPTDPDVYVAVRAGRGACAIRDSVVYSWDRGSASRTIEIGRCGSDCVIAVHGDEPFERVARFDRPFACGEVIVSPALAARGVYPISHPLDELIVMHRSVGSGSLVVRGSLATRDGQALVFLGDAAPPPDARGAACASGWLILSPNADSVLVHALSQSRGGGMALRLQGLHVTTDSRREEDALPSRLDSDAAVAELLRHAFAPVHDAVLAERLLGAATALAARVPVTQMGVSRPVPFAWRSSASMAYAPPQGI